MGSRRPQIAIVVASLLIAAQATTAGAALAATPTTTRILYAPVGPIVVGSPANFTAEIEPYATDRTVSWYVDGGVATTDLTNPNGISQVSLTVGVGVHEVKAVLEPGAGWDGSESDPYSLTVVAPTTGFVVDSEAGDPFGGGQLFDSDPGVLTGSAATINQVTTVTIDGDGWSFVFKSPSGGFSTVPTYTHSWNASLRVWRNGVLCGSNDWTYKVREIPTYGTGGELQAFGADFEIGCAFNNPSGIHGSVRFGSALPTRLLRVAPPKLAFPDTVVAAQSVDQTVTVQNVGGTDVAVQPIQLGGADPGQFAIDDGCGTVSLDPGQSCTFAGRFVPTVTTKHNATVTVPNDTFDTTRTVALTGYGISPTTLDPSTFVAHSRGGFVFAGDYRYEPAAIAASGTANSILLTLPDWSLRFSAPIGQILHAGSYPGAALYATDSAPGLQVIKSNQSCDPSLLVASFEILDEPVIDTDGRILRLAADFTMSCNGEPSDLRGWIRFHSNLPVPSDEPAAYSIDVNRLTAHVGDTITITPRSVGIDLFLVRRCTMVVEGHEDQPKFVRMHVSSDDCAPWTFTLPQSMSGDYVIKGMLFYGDERAFPQHWLQASDQTLTVLPGGTPVPFSSNYPVQSWALTDLVSDTTPTYGEAQTIKPRPGLDGCRLGFFGGYEGAWTQQDGGCNPWTFTVAEPTPTAVISMFGARADVHEYGWTGTSAWTDERVEVPFRGNRWGETYQGDVADFQGSGGAYTSSLPAIFTGAARSQVFYSTDTTTHPFAPVVRGATTGSCKIEFPPSETAITGGQCGTYDVATPDVESNGMFGVILELLDSGGQAIAGADTSVGFVLPLTPIGITAPSTTETGAPFTIRAADTAGVPATYAISVAPAGGASATTASADIVSAGFAASPTQTFTGTFPVSFAAAGGQVSIPAPALAAGTYSISATFTDVKGHGVTALKTLTVLIAQGPTGTISIAGGATWTKTTAVTVATGATDAGSGVSQVALSNDGITWITRPYAATQAWSLPATNGTRTVWARWKDGAGNWSAAKADTIVLDTVAPTVTAPTSKLGAAGAALVAGAIPVGLGWTGTDATSGIAAYHLSQQTDGGAWTSLSTTLTSTALTRSLLPGHAYRFAVRAVDRAGNVGGWGYGPTFRLMAIQQTSAAVHYAGTWTSSTSTTWWGGTAKGSSSRGATASLTFTGRSVAWIGLKASNRGKAQVYVNGVLTATVDLYSATLQKQRVAWSASWSTAGTRTIVIKVLGTTTRPRIDIDGFITGS